MAILNNSNAISSGGYDINNSLRFRSSASASLSRTPASSGNRKTFTWSGWVKRGALTVVQRIFEAGTVGGAESGIQFYGASNLDSIEIYYYSGSYQWQLTTTQLFRDPSAWYHIVVAIDTTQATAANRIKLYINGQQVTAFATASYPTQNSDTIFNTSGTANYIGTVGSDTSNFFDGYMADINFIDGSQKAASDFGETDTTTGVWKPKAYTGTYGTNGFYLKFSDIATTSGSNAGLGKDFSGNANYLTTNNISVTAGTTYDAMIDSPTLTSATVANYCVWNPLLSGTKLSTSNGNLNYASATTGASEHMIGTFMMPAAGKWYFEVTPTSFNTADGSCRIGISRNGSTDDSNLIVYNATGNFETYGVTDSAPNTYTQNDIIGVAVNFDADTVTFYKNNTSEGSKSFGSSDEFVPYVRFFRNSGTMTGVANFGQRPFAYTPPTGFVRLNTYNLPDSTIKKGNTVMDATLYTGNLTGQSITNAAAFKPDLVWIKSRSAATDHKLTDSNRGATIALVSNSTAAETTDLTGMTAFNTNGFTLGASTTYNNTGATYVGWQWQAGQGTNTSNTSGSITSTVSVNATAGFSIVTYTGTGSAATIGHGLGVAPRMIIVKGRNATIEWLVYHASLGATQYITLNTQGTAASAASAWNNTAPTSSVFSVLSAGSTNFSGTNYVAYCWAEIAGYSKFGNYTGVSGADGKFVYTGFRPKFVMIKSSNLDGENWAIFDTSRNTYNVTYLELFPNASNAEVDGAARGAVLDLLSNGFKIRATNPELNDSAGSYIYMAFAENPFKNALAR